VIISVVIPTLNEERLVAETVRHTIGLGFTEVLIVDGGSTDRTWAIVRSFEFDDRSSLVSRISQANDASRDTLHTSKILLESPPGRARQLNAGGQAARGDVLLFLHADTRLPPSAKSCIEAALADRLVVGGRFDVQFDSSFLWARLVSTFMNLRSRWTSISTGDQAMFVRRNVFEQLGGFSDIPLMEDIEFSARLKRRGSVIALRERVITSFRRWERHGPVTTICLMWVLRFLYWIGVNPHRLVRFYHAVR
jgi:rSAM/selenodomain-associated transferase 2